MSEEFTLDAELRSDLGKGASRRLRRSNKVPAIIYGGEGDAQSITIKHNELIHRLENEAFYSHILTINVDGKSQEAVLRDLQRHPAKPIVLHADFQRVSKDREIHVHVPIHFINEEKCAGVKLGGGLVSKTLTEVEVTCFPQNLPEFIEVDLLNLELGQAVHLSELALPEGVRVLSLLQGSEHDAVVVSVHKHRGMLEEDERPAEAAEGEEEKAESQEASDSE